LILKKAFKPDISCGNTSFLNDFQDTDFYGNVSGLIKKIIMNIYIKYMVSDRCKMAVKETLKKLGIHVIQVELGVVEILDELPENKIMQLKDALLLLGFELIEDRRAILIERIKNTVIEMVHHSDDMLKVNFSDYLSEKMNYDYTYLANIFSEVQGTSIEHFIITHKVERVKEFIIYDELSITEIAYKMNYSSLAHLSGQFKRITGLTPSYFRKLKLKRLEPIENIRG